jgi:hypothetical protein
MTMSREDSMCGEQVLRRPNWVRSAVTVVFLAGFMYCCLTSAVPSAASGRRPSKSTAPLPAVPRALSLDLYHGWVMDVLAFRQWQFVEVTFVRRGRGRYREMKSVQYGLGSEADKGIGDPWPDLSANVEPGEISAHFGPLGSIDVHFIRGAGSHGYRPRCRGDAVRFLRGHFEGSVHFSGGHGHPPVEATKAQAAPTLELQSKCTGGWVAEGPPTLPGAELLADSVQSSTPYFEAFKVNPHARSTIGVGINESDRGVSVSRFVQVLAPAEAFQYSHSLERTIVRPPAPFSGSGSYSAVRDRRHRWSGNLSVDFPGRAGVSLTQPPLHGFISPARWVPPRAKKVR